MVLGYAGIYLCRSNLSVTLPLIIDDLKARGIDPDAATVRLGWVITLGTLGYALGKFAAGGLVDLLGGRRNYLIGMAGAVACTLLFAMGGSLPVFTLVWFAQPADPVAGLAGHDQDHLAMVLVFAIRHGDGRDQPELPVRRHGRAGLHGLR